MKKKSLAATILLAATAAATQAATIDVAPGANLKSVLEGASSGDIIRLAAGTYGPINRDITTTTNLTVIGVPFEESNNDRSRIQDVVILHGGAEEGDKWMANGETTLRGITLAGNGHLFIANRKTLIEYCIFRDGVDQLSFDKDGYGEVRYCEFYGAGDDGIDIDFKDKEKVTGSYIDIHHNHIENTREDGIEFRTYERKRAKDLMIMQFHHNTFLNCGLGSVEDTAGGDAIQIIDQNGDGDPNTDYQSRHILIFNNTFDGQNQTRNGVGCNELDSNAQSNSIGSPTQDEPIWLWNNTFARMKSAAIAGAEHCWAMNNIAIDCKLGYVRCDVRNSLTFNVDTPLGTAAVDAGGNFFNQDPEMNPSTLELVADGFSLDKGLISALLGDADHSRLIEPAYMGGAPDLGALEISGPPPVNVPPRFIGNLIALERHLYGTPFSTNIADKVSETDGDALSYAISGPAWLSIDNAGTLSGTPALSDAGDSSWTITVSDKDGSDDVSLEFHVWNGVVPPLVADAGPDKTVMADASGTVSVTLSAAASQGDIVQYLWLTNGVAVKATAIAEQDFGVGTNAVTLRVTDSQGDVDTDELLVIVTKYESGMVVDAGPDQVIIVPAGGTATVTLDASASVYDPANVADKNPLLWKKRVGEGVETAGETLAISDTLTAGAYEYVFRIKDAAGVVERDTVVVYVIEAGSDVDGDGMEDIWEYTNYGDMNAKGTTDFDLDGMVDADEFIAGTDPSDPNSTFTLSTAGETVIEWEAVEGRTYKVLAAPTLTNEFTVVADGLDYPVNSYTGTVEGAKFYKLEVSIK